MSATPDQCPKCNGQMEQGFVLDFTYGTRLVSQWVPGAPEKVFLIGIKIPKMIPIGTFRCVSCGFLESYARPEFAAQKKS
jgi:Domain of unknown function (DUF6487)